jgi:hypothetical protein
VSQQKSAKAEAAIGIEKDSLQREGAVVAEELRKLEAAIKAINTRIAEEVQLRFMDSMQAEVERIMIKYAKQKCEQLQMYSESYQ